MAPKQKTFELIPDLHGIAHAQQHAAAAAAAAAVQSKPPMTTKQAKKLYREKTKGPKLSKAEQRRIDLMEQDRIRKEFEKEKAQARARAARDKKKAKEDKEKGERRVKGLPLIDVHPSQDTISRFISRLGVRRGAESHSSINQSRHEAVKEAHFESATEGESDIDNRLEPNNEDVKYLDQGPDKEAPGKENIEPGYAFGDSAGRPAKRQKFNQFCGNLLDRMIGPPSQRSVGAIAMAAKHTEMESLSRPSSIDTHDAANEVMLKDQLIADVELASSTSVINSNPCKLSPAKEIPPSQPPKNAPIAPGISPPQLLSPRSRARPHRPQSVQARQPHVGACLPSGRTILKDNGRARDDEDVFKRLASPFNPIVKQRPASSSTVDGNPSATPRFKPLGRARAAEYVKPRFLSEQIKATPGPAPVQASPMHAGPRRLASDITDAEPTSTQLLVMNHVDELFPSPSQEARELSEDQPSRTSTKAPTSRPPLLWHPPKYASETANGENRRRSVETRQRLALPLQNQAHRNVPSEFSLLMTQDLVLSSQDMEEMETPSKVQTDSASRSLREPTHVATLPSRAPAESVNSNTKLASKTQAFTEAKAPAPATDHVAKTTNIEQDRRHPPLASVNGTEARVKPLGQVVNKIYNFPQCSAEVLNCTRIQGLSNVSRPSRPISQSVLTPHMASGRHGTIGHSQRNEGPICRPSSFRCTHPQGKPSQGDSSLHGNDAAHRLQKGFAEPLSSPSKKRMFGSNGTGAEVLVAMERSYQQNLREERRRKEEFHAMERTRAERQVAVDSSDQELAKLVEHTLVGDEAIVEAIESINSGDNSNRGRGSANKTCAAEGSQSPQEMWTGSTASQETDYGDFDFEAGGELEILAEFPWADDDLSDI